MKFIPKMHPFIPDGKAENGSVKCVYVYVCMYIYICTHTHTHNWHSDLKGLCLWAIVRQQI